MQLSLRIVPDAESGDNAYDIKSHLEKIKSHPNQGLLHELVDMYNTLPRSTYLLISLAKGRKPMQKLASS